MVTDMYQLNKAVAFFVNPVGVAVFVGIICLICVRLKRLRAAKLFGWFVLAWLWLWMTPFATRLVGLPLEREFLVDGRVPDVETFPNAEAIVLLGGGMGVDTNLCSYADMSSRADRVWQAARLYKAGKAPKIISSGFCPKVSTLPFLNDLGLQEDCVTLLFARNTEEEAKAVEKLGCKKVLLVTSAWHMKRARLMFKKYAPDIEVVCAPADFEYTMAVRQEISLSMLLPSPYALGPNAGALHEWIGIMGYSLFR